MPCVRTRWGGPFCTGSCALLKQQGFLQEHEPWRQLVQSMPSLCIPNNTLAVSKGYGEPGRDHPARESPRDRLDVLKCVFSQKPSTDLTLTELSPARPRARLTSGFRILGMSCCPGCQPHTRMCIHTSFPSSCVAVGAHQPEPWAPNGLGSLVPQQGALIRHVIGVFLWHPQSSTVYAISSWMCWLIPQKEKVQTGAKQLQTQVWAHLAPVPGAMHPAPPCCAT